MASDVSIDEWTNDIHCGDCVDLLEQMPESSVHMAMCSPPYYGLRDYGVDGQIGLEDSLDAYIQSLVDVAGELRRVLRPDGSWWLNLGDSFAGSWGAQSKDETSNNLPQDGFPDKNPARNGALCRKSKMLVPHRVAIALEDAGWIVRADCPWVKPNPMPHPVKDRLHEHKEFVFHLTPEPDYWFDLDAIREPHADASIRRSSRADNRHEHSRRQSVANEETLDPDQFTHPNGKNPGDVFEISVKAFPEAHFAVYPPELCKNPIKASAPPKVCADCGTPYERTDGEMDVRANPNDRRQKTAALELVDENGLTDAHLEAVRAVGFHDADNSNHEHDGGYEKVDQETARLAREAKDELGSYAREFWTVPRESKGWRQTCDCYVVGDYIDPGIVLDPFAGAGTTCLVAKELGRQFIGLELNPEYVAMAQKRIGVGVDNPRLLEDVDENQATLGGVVDG